MSRDSRDTCFVISRSMHGPTRLREAQYGTGWRWRRTTGFPRDFSTGPTHRSSHCNSRRLTCRSITETPLSGASIMAKRTAAAQAVAQGPRRGRPKCVSVDMLNAVAQSLQELEALARESFILFLEPPSLDDRM